MAPLKRLKLNAGGRTSAVRNSRESNTGLAGWFNGLSPFVLGLLALGLLILAVVLVFGKGSLPSFNTTTVKAVVSDAKQIQVGAPVRIAGVQAGTVAGTNSYKGRSDQADLNSSQLSELELELNSDAPVIRNDATLKIRPRIFLEGNFFVDLQPGSPTAPQLKDSIIPLSQTSVSVQLDEVLGSLPADVRSNLRGSIQNLGQTFGDPETAAALNQTIKEANGALKPAASLVKSLRGAGKDDLAGLIKNTALLNGSLAGSTGQIRGSIVGLQKTVSALASDGSSLAQTANLLSQTMNLAEPTFAALNAAYPDTRELATRLLPGVQELPSTVKAARPWVSSARSLVAKDALGSWLGAARPAVSRVNKLQNALLHLSPEIGLTAKCYNQVLGPAGDTRIQDGRFTTGREISKELNYALVGVSSEAQGFDANGQWSRVHLTPLEAKGAQLGPTYDTGQVLPQGQLPLIGVRPMKPSVRPPYRSDLPCHTQPVPNPNLARAAITDKAEALPGGDRR